MSIGDLSHDDCPNCHQRFEIVLLKFKLAGPQMISACPNCAMIQDNDPKRASRLGELWKREHLLLNRPSRGAGNEVAAVRTSRRYSFVRDRTPGDAK